MKEREHWIDLLKVFSILGVVMIHVTYTGTFIDPNKYHNVWFLHMILDCISQFAVPIFIMVSGYLHLKKERTIKYCILNAFKLITIFFIASIAYSIYDNLYILKIDTDVYKKIITCIFSGEYHLWFLPMLAGLYILTPLIKPIIDNKSGSKFIVYFLAIWFIMNTLSQFSFLFTDTKIWQYSAYTFYQKLSIPTVSNYLGYYILGYYLANTKLSKNIQVIIYSLGILLIISSIYLSNVISYHSEYNRYSFMGNMYPMYIIYCSSIFLFFKNIIGKIKFNKIGEYCLKIISKSTFIVYLIHVFCIKYLINKHEMTYITYELNGSLLQIIKYFSITIIVSFVISVISLLLLLLIKKIIINSINKVIIKYELSKLGGINYER